MKKLIFIIILFFNLIPVLKKGEIRFSGPETALADMFGGELDEVIVTPEPEPDEPEEPVVNPEPDFPDDDPEQVPEDPDDMPIEETSPDPCSQADQAAGVAATNLFNKPSITSELNALKDLTALDNEHSFGMNLDGTPTSMNEGTPTGVSAPTGTNIGATYHNHPSGNPPSARDIITFGGVICGLSPNQTGAFSVSPDGTAYGLIVTDKNLLEDFWLANNNAVLSNNGWNPNSSIGADHLAVYNYFKDLNPPVSNLEAYERATAYVLSNSGLTLVKKDSNSNTFKKIGTTKQSNNGQDSYEGSNCP